MPLSAATMPRVTKNPQPGVGIAPAAQAASRDPVAQAASRDPVAQAASRDLVAQAASRDLVARAASRDLVARAASRDLVAQAFQACVLCLALVCLVACGSPGANSDSAAADAPAPVGTTAAALRAAASRTADRPRETASDGRPRIVILGDSLTAGLGLPLDEAYPSQLQQRLERDGLDYEVVNAGVSGDTSAGGLSRLDWALQGDVRILVVALGGNDGLRGLPPGALSDNLSQIIDRAQGRGLGVVLAGMEAPPNYGRDYQVAFHQVYPALAAKFHVALVPFLLEDVAGIAALNQPDGIHPSAQGATIVASNVWTALGPLVRADVQAASSGARHR